MNLKEGAAHDPRRNIHRTGSRTDARVQKRTSDDPRPLVEVEPAPAAACLGEKDPTPTHSRAAHRAENKITTPAAAAGTPLLRFLPPFLLLIPARTLPVVAASASAAADEGGRNGIAARKAAFQEGSLRLFVVFSLAFCGLSFPPLDLLGVLFLINED